MNSSLRYRSTLFCSAVLLLGLIAPARAANIVWTNSAGGNWNAPGNWSPNQVPAGGDTAVFSTAGTYTVAVTDSESVSNLVLGAATGTLTLNISSAALTVNGSGNDSAQSALVVSGGSLLGAGSIAIGGPLTWSGGDIYTTVQFNGGSQSGGENLRGGMLINSGPFTWNGTIYLYPGAQVSNLVSGAISLAAGASMSGNGGTNFDNAGLVNVAGTGTVSVGVPFNNHGTVTVSSGTLQLGGGGTETGMFTSAVGATLNLGGGTYAFSGGSSIGGAGDFIISSGTVNITGACTITNPLAIAGGALNLNGTGTITPVSLTMSGGSENGSQTLQVMNNGGFTWSGGDIYGTVLFNGGSQSGGENLRGGTLINNGPFAWNGTIYLYPGAQISNLVSGTISLGAGASASGNGGTNFDNAGLVNVAGAGTASVGVLFNNHGTVTVSSGTLQLGGGGTENGMFTNAAGATLELGSGTYAFNGGSIGGAGDFIISSGTVNITGACTITTPLVIAAGALNLNGTGTITPSSLTMSGGSENGSQTLQVLSSGGFTWSGGDIYGTILFNGGSQNGGENLRGGTLINSGPFAWNGTIYVYPGAQISNLVSGTVSLSAAASAPDEGGGNTFDNAGQVNVTGTRTATLGVLFNNHGMVTVSSGTLQLGGGGTEAGMFTSATGGTLNLSGGTYAFNVGSSIGGAGNFTVSAGAANLAGALNVGGICSFNGGTANVTGACTITNALVIANGALNLNGTGTITPSNLTMSGGSENGSQTLQVLSSGGFTWSGGDIYGTILFNGGSQNGGENLRGGTLINSGPFAWNGTIYVYPGAQISNLVSGTIALSASASAPSEGDGNNFDNAGQIDVTGTGTASVSVPFNNHGTVTVSSGALQLGGAVSLAGGTLIFGINNRNDFGTLKLSGSAGLTGTLGATLNGYTPILGDSFPLITYGSKTGTFTSFNLPAQLNWQQSYGSTAYTISIGNSLSFSLNVSQPAWTANGFNLTIAGPVGSNYTILATTDLAQNKWSTLTSFVSTFTQTSFADTNAPPVGIARLYRAYMR